MCSILYSGIWWKKTNFLGGDFNLFFDSTVDAQGGSPIIKKSMLKTNPGKKINVGDIWQIRNPKERHFTFRQSWHGFYLKMTLTFLF